MENVQNMKGASKYHTLYSHPYRSEIITHQFAQHERKIWLVFLVCYLHSLWPAVVNAVMKLWVP